jgi:glyoxylase-like metal-dependent hydrolase (beta-lactamase superfamily II)
MGADNRSHTGEDHPLQIGRVKLFLVNDGLMWLDGGGAFGLTPRVIWEKLLTPDVLNRVPLCLGCLLIQTDGKTILVDTGLGNHLTKKQRRNFGLIREGDDVIQALARLGVRPEAVDIVINTHLHADHCGGNTTRLGDSTEIIPTFPNAEYWIQRLEWADAVFPNERTRAAYLSENFLPIEASGQLRLLNGDTRLSNEIRTVVTRGHTRAHQSLVIESEGEVALFTGDLATLAVHFERLAWVTAYDVEPLETIETKRAWQRWALERNALLIFPHDTQTPIARLQEDPQGRIRIKPVSYSVPTQQLRA